MKEMYLINESEQDIIGTCLSRSNDEEKALQQSFKFFFIFNQNNRFIGACSESKIEQLLTKDSNLTFVPCSEKEYAYFLTTAGAMLPQNIFGRKKFNRHTIRNLITI